jgi:CHAD domain-containing protein
MRSPRYLTLLDRLVDAARAPRLLEPDPSRPRRRARRLARHPWRRLRRTIRALGDDPTDEQLHEVRKRAKQARYALEAIAPISPRRVTRLAEHISEVQDVLGEQHDAIGAVAWLRAAAADHDEPGVAFAAGVLAAGFARDGARRRDEWRRPWRRARRVAADVF